MKSATRATAYKFLRNHKTAVVATLSSRGEVSTTPVTYTLTKNKSIRFVTKDKTTKYKDIVDGSSVALSVVDTDNLTSVNITGKAMLTYDTEEIVQTLKKIDGSRKDDEVPPIIKLSKGELVVVDITLTRLQFTCFSDKSDELTEYIYDL